MKTSCTELQRSVLVVYGLHEELNLWLCANEAYRGADKSLNLPGRKQARKHVGDAREFNNIETRAVIRIFFPARQGAEGNTRHSDRNINPLAPELFLLNFCTPCI